MLEIRRVLFPTDLSEYAEEALPHAVRFAETFGAELHLLHVLVLHAATAAETIQEFPGESEAREALEGAARGAGERVKHAVRRGIAAAPTILTYADENDIDVIVMGSHGRRGLRRFFLGSVAEEVVRAGEWPVLIVHRTEEGAAPAEYRRILAPVDFSERTTFALDHAVALAEKFGAGLRLLHVVEVATYPDFYIPVSLTAVDVSRVREQAQTRLVEMAEPLRARIPVEIEVRIGRTIGEILDAAAEGSSDLIVMPSHGYSGLERALLGSVTEGVLRRAGCPVLTLKAYGKDLRAEPAAAGSGASFEPGA